MTRGERPGDSRTVEVPSPSLVYGDTVELPTPGRAPAPGALPSEEGPLPPTERAPRRGRRLAVVGIGAALAATALGVGAAMLIVRHGPSADDETDADATVAEEPSASAAAAPTPGRPCPTAPSVAKIELGGVPGPKLVERLGQLGFSCDEAVDFGDGARLSLTAPDRTKLLVTLTATDADLGLMSQFTNTPSRAGSHGRITVRWEAHPKQAEALLTRLVAPE